MPEDRYRTRGYQPPFDQLPWKDEDANDNAYIVMISGASFRVGPLDQSDAMFWFAADDVLICKDETEIVNKNEKHERIRVSRIR